MPRLGGFYGARPATTGGGGAAPSPDPNANLLLWSEETDNVVWVGASSVSANSVTDPLGGTTADRATIASGGQHVQTTGIAAASGASSFSSQTLTSTLTRLSVSGTFDGQTYVYSEWLASPGGQDINLAILRSGGVLVAGLVDLDDLGDNLVIDRWGAKLETPSLTDYVKREGT